MKREPRPKATKIILQGTDSGDDFEFLDVAPTMKRITYKGRNYFRCPSLGQDPADGQWGRMYLWSGWGDWKLAQINASEKAAS